MKSFGLRRATLVVALSTAPLGCALLTKSDPVVFRYFTPETLGARPDPSGDARPMRSTSLDLRMGRVNAASYLKERIAFREKSFEVGYYEELRWTEKPEAYLGRALGRALFEENGVHQIISGAGPTLDVDLDAFEEIRSPRHAARMQVTWVLHDDQRVQFQETFTIERLIPSSAPSRPGEIATAMAEAFNESVERVVAQVVAALSKSATTVSPPTGTDGPPGAPCVVAQP